MMREMGRRKPKLNRLLTQGIFNLPHHTGRIKEELAFDETKIYIKRKWIATQLNAMAVTGFIPGAPTQCINQLSYIPILRVYT